MRLLQKAVLTNSRELRRVSSTARNCTATMGRCKIRLTAFPSSFSSAEEENMETGMVCLQPIQNSGTKELSIVEKIWLLIIEVVTSIAEQVSADYNELMESAINGNKHLKRLFEPYLKGGEAA